MVGSNIRMSFYSVVLMVSVFIIILSRLIIECMEKMCFRFDVGLMVFIFSLSGLVESMMFVWFYVVI